MVAFPKIAPVPGMRGPPILLESLVIPNSGTASNSIDMRKTFYRGLTIFGPATPTNTITVEVSHNDTNWCTLQSAGSDVDIGAAEAVTIDFSGYPYLRLASAGAEGAERTFPVYAVEDIL